MNAVRNLLCALSLMAFCWTGTAFAQSCEVVPGTEDLVFDPDIPANPTVTSEANGSVQIRCTREFLDLRNTKVCVGISAGSWDSAGVRRMALYSNSAVRLDYDLLDSSSQPVGTLEGIGGAPLEATIRWEFFEYSRTVSLPIRGVIRPGQSALPPGAYVAEMSASLASRRGNGTCRSASVDEVFQVRSSAGIKASCSVVASELRFPLPPGTKLDSPINGQATIGINCSYGAPYTVHLGSGSSGGNTIATRRMALDGIGNGVIEYELLTESGQRWGDGTGGTVVVTDTGIGNSQNLSVHGRVPQQNTPAVGTYRDTVTVTVDFSGN